MDAHVPAGATGLVIALSGGADSSSLLAALAALIPSFRSLPLRALHVDHGLQSAAQVFRDACMRLCAQLDIPLTVLSVTVDTTSGESVEAAARDARYAAIAQNLRVGECVLTAHHRQDQAETLLLQTLRGAGVKGMAAMPSRRPLGPGWHVRPLLHMPQHELLAFAVNARPAPDDPMNVDLRFDRSYLRGRVWPLIEARWPGASGAIARTARHLAQAQTMLDRSAADVVARLRDGDALSVPQLRALEVQDRICAVRYWLADAGIEAPPTARIHEALRQMLEADADQLPAIVWGQHALRRYRHRVFVTPADPPRLTDIKPWTAVPGADVALGPGLGQLHWALGLGGIDPQRLPGPLAVRCRAGGETLKPAMRASTQAVRHLLQEHGVLPWMRDALPFIVAGENLIAVADLWMDAPWCVPANAPGLLCVWNDGPIIV